MSASKHKKRRRRIVTALAVALLVVIGLLARPTVHLIRTAWRDVDELENPPAGHVDDASRLNETRVAEVWNISPFKVEMGSLRRVR